MFKSFIWLALWLIASAFALNGWGAGHEALAQDCRSRIILTPSSSSCDFAIVNGETYVSAGSSRGYYNYGRLRIDGTVIATPLAQNALLQKGEVTRVYLSPASPSGRYRYVTTFSGDLLLDQFLFDGKTKELRITNAGRYASDGDSIRWSPSERFALLSSKLEGFQLVHVLESQSGAHAHFPNWGRKDDPSSFLTMRMDDAFLWTSDDEFVLNAALCRSQAGADCLKALSTQQKRPTVLVVKDGPRIEEKAVSGRTASVGQTQDMQVRPGQEQNSQQTLTRERAAAAIKERLENTVVAVQLATGTLHWHSTIADRPVWQRYQKLLAPNILAGSCSPFTNISECSVAVGPAAKAFAIRPNAKIVQTTAFQPIAYTPLPTIRLEGASYRFVEVTGITGNSQVKQVEYRYEKVRTRVGELLELTDDEMATPTMAQFQLYDDGWRLMNSLF